MDVAQLYLRHGAMVKRRAAYLLHDDAAAQDVVQEVFLRLWGRQEELQAGGMASWLYTTATRISIDLMRRRVVRERDVQLPPPPTPVPADQKMALMQMVAALPDDLAALAVYRFVDDMTHDEIAEVTGHSRRHVGNLLQRLQLQFIELRHAS